MQFSKRNSNWLRVDMDPSLMLGKLQVGESAGLPRSFLRTSSRRNTHGVFAANLIANVFQTKIFCTVRTVLLFDSFGANAKHGVEIAVA